MKTVILAILALALVGCNRLPDEPERDALSHHPPPETPVYATPTPPSPFDTPPPGVTPPHHPPPETVVPAPTYTPTPTSPTDDGMRRPTPRVVGTRQPL